MAKPWPCAGATGFASMGSPLNVVAGMARELHAIGEKLRAGHFLITGTLAGLLGIGGGVVLVPAMSVFFNELSVVAKGTSVAVIIPTSIMGTWRNWKADNIDLRVAAIVGMSGIISAIGGGIIADQMSQDLSNILFASLVLIVAIRMVWDLQRNPDNNH